MTPVELEIVKELLNAASTQEHYLETFCNEYRDIQESEMFQPVRPDTYPVRLSKPRILRAIENGQFLLNAEDSHRKKYNTR